MDIGAESEFVNWLMITFLRMMPQRYWTFKINNIWEALKKPPLLWNIVYIFESKTEFFIKKYKSRGGSLRMENNASLNLSGTARILGGEMRCFLPPDTAPMMYIH
jgi:hypothetical protein